MRNTKESILEYPLIHLSIWIRNYVVMNEEKDEARLIIREKKMGAIKY